jgi:AraC-like DNA-binding protein
VTITRVDTAGIRLQIVTPPRDLAPYITAFYRTEAHVGLPVEDWLPPEWANLRVGKGEVYEAGIGEASLQQVPVAVLSGPTSRVTRLRIAGGIFWGAGLLPLGWAKFIGAPASDFTDRFRDAAGHPALAPLQSLIERLADAPDDMDRNLALLTATFRALLAKPMREHEAIVRTHAAILSDRFTTVAALAEHLGTSTRTLERFTRRHFGFAPKLLLRRQRFLRSLARFMVDPSLKWIDSLDSQYHDQAQFVREFKHFMLMRPRDYAAMEHPIALTAVRARRMALGDAMQVLHPPDRARDDAIEPAE